MYTHFTACEVRVAKQFGQSQKVVSCRIEIWIQVYLMSKSTYISPSTLYFLLCSIQWANESFKTMEAFLIASIKIYLCNIFLKTSQDPRSCLKQSTVWYGLTSKIGTWRGHYYAFLNIEDSHLIKWQYANFSLAFWLCSLIWFLAWISLSVVS